MVYLDYNATTPVAPEVRSVIAEYLGDEYGNPSSMHAMGIRARNAVDAGRNAVANLLGATADEIVFTGSATEANNLALLGSAAVMPAGRRHLIVSAIEHPAVFEPARRLERMGWKLSVVPVGQDARVDLVALERLLNDRATGLISIMHANNELGTIQPIEQVGVLAHRYGALLHVDAAQSVGKIEVNVDDLGADLLTVAGHKMYAPKGIGALYVRRGTPLTPIQFGASQEGALRPGTENVAYIAGMGAAARLVGGAGQVRQQMARLRDHLEQRLLTTLPGLTVNGSREHRLPNTLHVSLPSCSARSLLLLLKDRIALSPGAACHAADGNEPSGVMNAIGATAEQSHGALRISLGFDTTDADIETAFRVIVEAYRSLMQSEQQEVM
jgi:cysteine desulfurase